MNVEQIIEVLEHLEVGVFPREALRQAMAKKDEITPVLLDILRDAEQMLDRMTREESYMLPLYAMYLLAYFREKRAYPLIVEFFSIPGEATLDATGDFVTEDLGRVLASVSHGDTSLIESLIENPHVNGYVRNAGMRALLSLYMEGDQSREEVLAYYRHLFQGGLERENSFVWGCLVSCCTALYPDEVMDDIQRAFADDLVEAFYIGESSVHETLTLGKEKVLERLMTDSRYSYIGDVEKEIEWWACFQKPRPVPVVATTPNKVGRNDPCPCGSGKKYKHCCGSRRQ